MVAYGLEIVTVVSGVVLDDSGGGDSSAALSVGDGGAWLVGLRSVVDTGDEVGTDVAVGARGVEGAVVRAEGITGAGACWRELFAVSMTASTRITSSSTAATPET